MLVLHRRFTKYRKRDKPRLKKKIKTNKAKDKAKDLKENVVEFKISTLSDDQAADLVLIIGQDFK